MNRPYNFPPIPPEKIDFRVYETVKPDARWMYGYLQLAGLGITQPCCSWGKLNEQNPLCLMCSGISDDCPSCQKTEITPREYLLGSRINEPGKAIIRFRMGYAETYRQWIANKPGQLDAPCGFTANLMDDLLRISLSLQESGKLNLGDKLKSEES